jgi:hypothetical protein
VRQHRQELAVTLYYSFIHYKEVALLSKQTAAILDSELQTIALRKRYYYLLVSSAKDKKTRKQGLFFLMQDFFQQSTPIDGETTNAQSFWLSRKLNLDTDKDRPPEAKDTECARMARRSAVHAYK